jgi:hypothetical protein
LSPKADFHPVEYQSDGGFTSSAYPQQICLQTSLFGGVMHAWPVQDTKARFSEFLEACLTTGPQMVTKRGAGLGSD